MKRTRFQTALRIARQTYESDEDVREIYYVRSALTKATKGTTPVVLVHVNEGTVPVGIVPLVFSAEPQAGIPYPYVIVDVTPSEFRHLQEQLENGQEVPGWRPEWELGRKIPRKTIPQKVLTEG